MVTGEMVEELILAGADIIKVGIGPGDIISHLLPKFQMLFKFTLHRFHTYFHVCRFCVHHSHEDRRGLSSAECSH